MIVFSLFILGCEQTEESITTPKEIENAEVDVKITNDDATIKVETENNVVEETISKDDTKQLEDMETKTFENENISVNTSVEDGVIKNEVVIKNSEVPTQDLGNIDEWCLAGEKYDFSNEDGVVTADIVGPTTYKGVEVCEATTTTTTEYFDMTSQYFFSEGAKEIWVVTDVAGQKTETYVKNE